MLFSLKIITKNQYFIKHQPFTCQFHDLKNPLTIWQIFSLVWQSWEFPSLFMLICLFQLINKYFWCNMAMTYTPMLILVSVSWQKTCPLFTLAGLQFITYSLLPSPSTPHSGLWAFCHTESESQGPEEASPVWFTPTLGFVPAEWWRGHSQFVSSTAVRCQNLFKKNIWKNVKALHSPQLT